jgi:hypothetical protein
MPLIQWGDLVNKSDETIELDPGDSIEVKVTQIGGEIRVEDQP